MLTTEQRQANPYVGPRPFETGEALHGRDDELYRLFNLLIAKRIVLLHSPSGAGKTSLIQAGLVPRLEQDRFRVLPVIRVNLDLALPEGASTANRYLVSTVSSLDRPLPPSEQVSLSDLQDMDLSTYLDRRRGASEGGYEVLIFDQFEELLTLDPTDQEAKEAFMAQVGDALRNRRRWALFAMREEFIAALGPYTRPLPTRLSATFRLDLLGQQAAHVAMRAPAADRGVPFSDAAAGALVDELRRTRVQRADGVREELGPYVEPVQLQVVCSQLWERLPAGVTEITEAHVAELGDVNSALGEYYEAQVRKVAEKTGASERAIRDWFDQITEQGFRTQVLTGPEGAGDHDRAVLEALQHSHLIRAEQRRGATWYELAHDRLIAPVHASNARWREETLTPFQRAAITWKEYDRADALVPPDAILDQARPWLSEHLGKLTALEREFLTACHRVRAGRARAARQARRVRNLAVATSVVSVIALASLGLAVIKAGEASHQTGLAKARDLLLVAEASATTDPSLRTLLAYEAMERAGSGNERVAVDARRALYGAIYHSPPSPLFTLPATEATGMAVTADGRRLAVAHAESGDRQVEIWDLQTKDGAWAPATPEPATISGTNPTSAVAFSLDGQTLATAGSDGVPRLWRADAAAGRMPPLASFEQAASRQQNETPYLSVALSGDSTHVVTTGRGGQARVWDASSGKEVTNAANDFRQDVTAVAFDPRHPSQILAGYKTGRVELWRIGGQQPLATFEPHRGTVTAVAFDATGTRLATSAKDGRVIVRDPASSQSVHYLFHPHEVNALAFSPDGTRLATAGMDGRVVVWDVHTGRTVAIFSQGRPVRSVAFTSEGRLVIAADEAAPGVWDVPADAPVGHESQVVTISVSPDGTRAVTAGVDGTARLWDVSRPDGTAEQLLILPHGEWVNTASFSDDGLRVITASDDRTAVVWDAVTGRKVLSLPHEEWVAAAAFSPGGRQAITTSGEGVARTWDMANGNPIRSFGDENAVRSADYSPDGSRVITAEGSSARLWDAFSGRMLFSLPHRGKVTANAWAPDGSRLATADELGNVELWDPASGRQVDRPEEGPEGRHRDAVNAMVFSGDGRRLATASTDETARIWDAATGTELHRLQHDGEVHDVSFRPDGTIVATGSQSVGMLWNVESGREVARLRHNGTVNKVRFDPTGALVYTAADDGTARGWDASSGAPRLALSREPDHHSADVSDVEFSRDGGMLATASDDGTVRLWTASPPSSEPARLPGAVDGPGLRWDVAARSDSRTFRGHAGGVSEISISRDGKQLATASEDGTAEIWDVGSGVQVQMLEHGDDVADVAFSPDDKAIATASVDGEVRMWTRNGDALHPPRMHSGAVYSVAFSPDGRRLATASDDKTVQIWDVGSGAPVGGAIVHEDAVRDVVYGWKGKVMATASGASIRILGAGGTHEEVRKLRALTGESDEEAEVTSLAFSRDDRLLAAGTTDGIMVWDVGSGKEVLRVSQGDLVRAVSFAPDGRRLAVAGAGKEFYVYDLEISRAMVKKAAGRSLSRAECEKHLAERWC